MGKGSKFALVMEGVVDGQPHVERELTCYVRLADLLDVTSLAESQETHEQWRIKAEGKNANMRIRLTDEQEYTLTVKQSTDDPIAFMETEQRIESGLFNVLKKSFGFDGYMKTRYNIPIHGTDRKWEVDVFKTRSGVPSLWVKVDYEFAEGEGQMPEIPFPYREIIIPDIEEGKEDIVSQLWAEEWAKLNEEDS